jgi:hypothetical protein
VAYPKGKVLDCSLAYLKLDGWEKFGCSKVGASPIPCLIKSTREEGDSKLTEKIVGLLAA